MTLDERIKSDIERISKTVTDLMTATTEPGFNQAPAIAQFLSQFYTGLESCLEKKLKLAGIETPGKTDKFHQALLAQAIKSDLVPASCAQEIKDLLGFRHFARHGYGAEFRLDEVKQKAANVEKAWNEMNAYWEAQKAGADSNEPARPRQEEIPKPPGPEQIAQMQQATQDRQKRQTGGGKKD